jgi:hypothetical protein
LLSTAILTLQSVMIYHHHISLVSTRRKIMAVLMSAHNNANTTNDLNASDDVDALDDMNAPTNKTTPPTIAIPETTPDPTKVAAPNTAATPDSESGSPGRRQLHFFNEQYHLLLRLCAKISHLRTQFFALVASLATQLT